MIPKVLRCREHYWERRRRLISIRRRCRRLLDEFVPIEEEPAEFERTAGIPPVEQRLRARAAHPRVTSVPEDIHSSVLQPGGKTVLPYALPGDHFGPAHRKGRSRGQRGANQQQSAPGHFDCATLSGARASDGGPDAGRRHRPDPRGGEVQLAARLSLQHLCHPLGTADDTARHRQQRAQHPPARLCGGYYRAA